MKFRNQVVWCGLLLAGLFGLVLGRPTLHPAVADSPALKIMPLGDSITSGTNQRASYRCALFQKLVAAGYSFDFVGSVPGQWGIWGEDLTPPFFVNGYDSDEEGHYAFRIDDILYGANWDGDLQVWANDAQPDVVLVHLGTNDLRHDRPVDSTVAGIGQVIDVLRVANPRVKILLAQIIPCRPDGVDGSELAAIPAFNAQLPALVASKTGPFSPILLVDLYTGFSAHDHTVDGIHPNPTGEAIIAERWLTAIDRIMRIQYWTFIPRMAR